MARGSYAPQEVRKPKSSKFVLRISTLDSEETTTMSYDLIPLTSIQANLLWSMNTVQLLRMLS